MNEQSTERLHDMFRLLSECGDDEECGCGCSGHDPEDEPEPKKKGKALNEKPKKKSTTEEIEAVLGEARRKLGLKRFRNIKHVAEIRSGGAPKIKNVRKTKQSIRSGAAHNRHR